MVGVPGRSKGCNTCIQRKIRCDMEVPFCGNCRKSSRLCLGYKRKLGYVLSQDMNLTELEETNNDKTTVTHHGRWRRTKKPQQPCPRASWSDHLAIQPLGYQISTSVALRQQYHYLFLDTLWPPELRAAGGPSSFSNNWIVQLQNVAVQSPALEAAIIAFSGSRVGRMYKDMDLICRCRSVYVLGLERLQQALRNPQTRLADETLATCMALSVYELSEGIKDSAAAYIAHMKAAMLLLELRGPDACTTPLRHSIFLALRTQTVTTSINFRRETFLCRPEWIQAPWKAIEKPPLEEILDPIFVVPRLLQQFDAVSRNKDLRIIRDAYFDIIEEYLNVDSTLRRLYGKFEDSFSGPLYSPELSTLESHLDDAKLGTVFPVSFHFPTIYVAQVAITYWSSMTAVHFHLAQVFDKLGAVQSYIASNGTANGLDILVADRNELCPDAIRSNVQARGHHEQWQTMVKNICQSVEYLMQEKMGAVGPLGILESLEGCRNCLRNDPESWKRQIEWVSDFIERIKDRLSSQLGAF